MLAAPLTFLSAWLTRLPTPSLSLAPLSAPAANKIYIKLGRALRSKCVSWLWHPLLIRRIGRALRIGNNLKEGKIATVVQHSAAHSVSAFPNCTYPQFAHTTSPISPLAPLPFHHPFTVSRSVCYLCFYIWLRFLMRDTRRVALRCAALLRSGVEGMFELRKHYCNQLPVTVSRGDRLWPPCRICIWRQK